MKPLMKPIDTPDQVFHDGNPSTGELGTICSAEWLNDTQGSIRDIQAECITILKANGFEPDETKRDQLWEAIQAAIKNHVPAASLVGAGIVQLSSSVTSDSETIAATSRAVKIAMNNANARLAKERNLADLTNVPLARQSLQLGNSATLNVGTTANTVAAGDDARIIATKKAIDDTQTGLAAQGVMWINTADDLSNLPSGARRFAINSTGVTVLPTADYFFIEVLAKRDTANGSCVLATSNTGDVWMGLRYTVPNDAAFTWIQLNQNVQNLGLTEAVKRALNAVQKTGDTMSAPLVNTHPDAFRLKQPGRSFFWRFDGASLYLLRTAINDPDGGWDGARPLYVNADSSQVFLGPDTKVNGTLYVGNARVATDGNIYGTRWNANGAWLWDTIAEQLAIRDNNINTRATWDWVSQNFVNDIFLGVEQYYSPGSNTISWIFHAPNGHVLTGINVQDTGAHSADNIGGVYYKPIQKKINGALMTIAG
ncbi:tail fiber protein [Salmonella enterica]|nr:tail fiber protein [Salmonella enterica]